MSNVVPFRRRPLSYPPVWSDGRPQATCDELVHVFATVPGRCQCGTQLWDGQPEPRNAEVPLTEGQEHCDAC